MHTRVLKYVTPLLIYIGSYQAFSVRGWQVWLPLIYAWLLVPLLELVISPDPVNMNAAEEELTRKDKKFDLILYAVVVLQYIILVKFLFAISQNNLQWSDIIGRIWVMGLVCGVFGINVGHELGHRANKGEQLLAKSLLLSSQYMHFFIEHNKGHHKRVATAEDPSTARYGEWVYHFYYRSIVYSYLSAWQIANKETKRKDSSVFSLNNEMIQYSLVQLAFISVIFFVFGWFVLLCYLFAAGIGILLLETVNYIEHYGLTRKVIADGKYERAMPTHSWNSDHLVGRLMLFELSRHSDHHFMASRKYQVLRHHHESPQMPTGYPGMMLLSLVPPAWFYVMNKRVLHYNSAQRPSNKTV